MIGSEDDWIRATTDPLDFCDGCGMHLTCCACDEQPCLYCGYISRNQERNDLYAPYCSPECSARAEGESIE